MSKTDDILAQRMRRIERTLGRVALILEEEVALRIKIHKAQAELMGTRRSDDKTENIVAMLALVRHHYELGASVQWRPNVNANEANGFAADPPAPKDESVEEAIRLAQESVDASQKRRTETDEKIRKLREMGFIKAEDPQQTYEYCVCEASPETHDYDMLRGELTFRELSTEAEAMGIAFTGNGVYAFRYDREARSNGRIWELISPVRKEDQADEKH